MFQPGEVLPADVQERANRNGRLPIVALTAHAMEGDEDRCLDAWIEKVSRHADVG